MLSLNAVRHTNTHADLLLKMVFSSQTQSRLFQMCSVMKASVPTDKYVLKQHNHVANQSLLCMLLTWVTPSYMYDGHS